MAQRLRCGGSGPRGALAAATLTLLLAGAAPAAAAAPPVPWAANATRATAQAGAPSGSGSVGAAAPGGVRDPAADGAPGATPAAAPRTARPWGTGVEGPPRVERISPSGGSAGTTVHIAGSGFGGAVAVMFGTSPATAIRVTSGGRITAVAPLGSGRVDVIVVAPGGLSQPTAASLFTYPAGGPASRHASAMAATPGVAARRAVTLDLSSSPPSPSVPWEAEDEGQWCPLYLAGQGGAMVGLLCGLDAFSSASAFWDPADRSAAFYAGSSRLTVAAGAETAQLSIGGGPAETLDLPAPAVIASESGPSRAVRTLLVPLSLLARAVGGTAASGGSTAEVTATVADAGYAQAQALVASLPAYPGSRRSNAPFPGGAPDVPLPGAPSPLRTVHRQWVVAAPEPQVDAWLLRTARHLGFRTPGGPPLACSRGGCPDVSTTVPVWLGGTHPHLPLIGVTLHPRGRSSTLVRYDALALDRPSRPAGHAVPAGAGGVTVAPGEDRSGAAGTTLGPAAPREASLGPAAAARLAAAVDVLPVANVRPGVCAVTAAAGRSPLRTHLVFRYPGAHPHTVSVIEFPGADLSFCPPGAVLADSGRQVFPALADPRGALLSLARDASSAVGSSGAPMPPMAFWSALEDRRVWFSLFPRRPGRQRCLIPYGYGGASPGVIGRCATATAVLSPGRLLVVLSQAWPGPGGTEDAAAWGFVLAPGGSVVRQVALGSPPEGQG